MAPALRYTARRRNVTLANDLGGSLAELGELKVRHHDLSAAGLLYPGQRRTAAARAARSGGCPGKDLDRRCP
jgi:hypothetical protein